MDAAVVLGWSATVVFLLRLLPQPIRLLRTGVPDGVSPMSVTNMALSELAWLVYGLTEHLVPVWAVSLPAFPVGALTVYLLRDQMTRRDLIGSGIWLAVILLGWVTGLLAFVLAGSVIVNFGPQVVTAVRGHDLDGLAPATWFIALADASLWGAYGLAVGDPAMIGYCVVLFTSATVILVRIAQTRRRELAAVELEMVFDPSIRLSPAAEGA